MNKEQEELLVRQFHGQSTKTYTEFEAIFLETTKHVLRDALLNEPTIIGLKVSDWPSPKGPVPMFYSGEAIKLRIDNGTNLRNDDIFSLTTHGENLLFQIKKERLNTRLLVIGVIMGTIAALASIVSIFKP